MKNRPHWVHSVSQNMTSADHVYALMASTPFDVAKPKLTISVDVIGNEDSPNAKALMVGTNGVEMRTYTDSGTSDNCFVNKSDFEDYERFHEPCEGQGADKTSKFKIYRHGKVTKLFVTNGKHTKLTFNSALHTPNLLANLVSIGHFNDAGFTIIFGGKTVKFIDPNGTNILTGKWSQGMYLLEPVEPHVAMIAKSIDKPTTLDVWHRRFGHAGISGLRELARKKLVDGLDITKGE